ncbi:MAG: hypothetical protein EZS28_034232 [Streblomastix strix]|uniref:FHA domain-containing protein n=1 Tax=Streblomastix strix TaxID=222440 RepID=A0A5J4UJK5_9EUKA|nr:MAG: hypothetical protein EZS28_034232 [Streblomastix strix]
MNFVILLAVSFAICDQSTSLNVEPVPIQSAEISLPLSSSTQHESVKVLESLTSATEQSSFKSTNSVCQFNVSQNISGSFRTVANALALSCTESGGYEILLLDSEHIEYLIINQQSTILIKGNNKFRTVWHLDSPHKETLNLKQGILTLDNIEFHFVILSKLEHI